MFHRKKNKVHLIITLILAFAIFMTSCQTPESTDTNSTQTAQAALNQVGTEMSADIEPTITSYPTATQAPTITPIPTKVPPTATPELPVSAATPLPGSGEVIDVTNASDVVPLAIYGKGTIEEISISPSGRWVAVATISGISIYDTDNPEDEVVYLPNQSIRSIDISSNGEVVAAGLQDGRIVILNLADGSIVQEFKAHEGPVLSIVISKDNLNLASGGDDNLVKVWTFETGQNRYTFTEHYGHINDLDFSPDSTLLASGSNDSQVIIWDITTGEALKIYDPQLGSITSLAFSSDGKYLASGSSDYSTYIFNMTDTETLPFVIPGNNKVRDVAFAPDMSQIAIGGDTNSIEIWEFLDEEGAYQGYQTLSLPHNYTVKSFEYTNDGSTLISGTWGTVLSWWKMPERELVKEIDRGLLISTGFINNEPYILSEPTTGSLSLYNADTLEEILSVEEAHSNTIYSGLLLPDGESLITVSYDGYRIWDVEDGKMIFEDISNPSYITSLEPSDDGKYIALGWADGEVEILDNDTLTSLMTLTHGSGSVRALAFSGDNNILATGGDDTVIRLWRITDGKELAALEGHGDVIFDVEFSPDDEMLASASSDYTIRLWQSINGEEEEWGNLIATLSDHNFRVKSVAFSPAGDLLASVSDDGTAILWNISGGQVLTTLPYFTGKNREIRFNDDGSLIYTWDWDGVMRIFGIQKPFD
ncbi:MAG: hypothetical protein J7K85_02705 [Anaerolineaceae bacterium]|nr:hypothetical protein [Anaerolineaceae bacterium]